MKASHEHYAGRVTDNGAEAAVSVIRCKKPVESILLLRRKKNKHDPWSGHFAFPGGRRDLVDRSIYDTCLRETREETGIVLQDSSLISILDTARAGGPLKAVLVQPYIFELEYRPSVRVETAEIEGYQWLTVEQFRCQKRHVHAEVLPGSYFPAYPLQDYFLWGFTYKILCRFLNVRFELTH